jgi:drug/metabolite transporter (DMT)-like permease
MPSVVASTSARRMAFAMLGLSIAIGSVSFTLVKIALDELSPSALAMGRVVVSAAVFALVIGLQPWRRRPVPRGERFLVFLCGFGGSAAFHLVFNSGYQRVSVPVGALIMATTPVLVAVGEVMFLHHRLRMSQSLGLVLTFAGCTVIGTSGASSGTSSTLGVLLVFGAVLIWAGVTVATRSVTDSYDPWWLNTPGTLVGAVFVLLVDPGGVREFAHLSAKGWLVVVWLGAASSAFIYYALAKVMREVSATAAMSASTVVTPTGVLVAWLVLGDRPTLVQVLGGVVVLVGVVLVTRRSSHDSVTKVPSSASTEGAL